MKNRGSSAVLRLFLAWLLLAYSIADARGAPTAPFKGTFAGVPIQSPASGVSISNVFAAINARGFGVPVCVSFENASQKIMVDVQFMVAYLDSAGNIFGSVSAFEDRSTLQLGAVEGIRPYYPGFRYNHPSTGPNCYWFWPGIVDLRGHLYRRGPTIASREEPVATMEAWVQTVKYADGTSWHAPTPMPGLPGSGDGGVPAPDAVSPGNKNGTSWRILAQ